MKNINIICLGKKNISDGLDTFFKLKKKIGNSKKAQKSNFQNRSI